MDKEPAKSSFPLAALVGVAPAELALRAIPAEHRDFLRLVVVTPGEERTPAMSLYLGLDRAPAFIAPQHRDPAARVPAGAWGKTRPILG